jgi:hypothetical protein
MDSVEEAQENVNLTLRVTNNIQGQGAQNKWNMTTASDGTTWWYWYQGGNQGEGQNQFEIDETNPTPESFTVSFHQNPDYDDLRMLAYVNKTSPTDLSGSLAEDLRSATVTDSCEHEGDYHWGLVVYDVGSPGVTIPCDPITRNRRT